MCLKLSFHLLLGQSDPAPLQHDMETYRQRLESFGFHAIVVDGHDIIELCKAFAEAESVTDKPTCLIAKTFKVSGLLEVVKS